MKVRVAIAASFFAFPALGQECESVIALSKIVNTVVVDQNSLEKHAANFCSEYSKSSGKSSDLSFGASYKFLAASLNSSNASTETVASRYCSAADFSKATADAYRQYIEIISPNAYSAYEQCIKYSRSDVRFYINPGTILPEEASISVSFAASQGENKAEIAFSSSSGVKCDWRNLSERVRVVAGNAIMQAPSSASIWCMRTNTMKPGYINIVRADGTLQPISIPWQAYNADGVPVNALASAEAAISNVQSTIADIQNQINANKADISEVALLSDWRELCVMSPKQDSCPKGFSSQGNFYACVPADSAIGWRVGGNPGCPFGTYHYNHITICCRP